MSVKGNKHRIFEIQDYYSTSGIHYSLPFNDSEPAIIPKTRTGMYDLELLGEGNIEFINNEYGKFVGGTDRIQISKTDDDSRNIPYIDYETGDGYTIMA
jgi:hypothetical protein